MGAVLAIDTSLYQTSVALITSRGEFLRSANAASHSDSLNELVSSVLLDAGISFKELDLLAYANGPGSFTGLRIGLAYLKGISLSLKIPITGVSTLKGMAIGTLKQDVLSISTIDARREEVFVGGYVLENDKVVTVFEPAILRSEAVQKFGEELAGTLRKSSLQFLGCVGIPLVEYGSVALGVGKLALESFESIKYEFGSTVSETPTYLRPVTFLTVNQRAEKGG